MTFRLRSENEDSAYLIMQKNHRYNETKTDSRMLDVASGATYSSKGIIAAVRNALKEAS